MIRPLVITIVSAIYLIASIDAQQPGTYNNVLSYFKEHPLIDQNGAPTETFQNVLKKVSTMSPPGGARPAAIPPITPFRPNGYSPNYAQYQNYAQAQYKQAQAQAQARAAAMLPPIPAITPPQAPPPATSSQPSQPAPEPAPAEKQQEPAPQPESSPEPQAAPAPQPEPQAAPEEPKQEPAAPESQANPEEAKPSEPAPDPAQEPAQEPTPEPAQEPQVANEEKPAWSPDHQPAQEMEQAQPTAEESTNLEAAPAQGEEQKQSEEASVTPAGDNDGSETPEITTEANDLGIPPASANMNNMTDTMPSNSSMLNNTTNGMMGSPVGIDGSTYTYSSIDMMAPSNSPQSPASAPTTYVPPMASAATLNTRFDDLLSLCLLFNVIAFIMA